MSSRRRRRPVAPAPPRKSPNLLMPLVAALGIGALLLGLLVAVIPTGDEPESTGQMGQTVAITPGAEEARMRQRLANDPNDVDAMLVLADLMANTGNGPEAIRLYERAIEQRPDDARLRIALGDLLRRYNHQYDAEIQLKKARELAPNDPEPTYLLGVLYAQARPPQKEQAREMFQAVIDSAPDSIYAQRSREQIEQLDKAG